MNPDESLAFFKTNLSADEQAIAWRKFADELCDSWVFEFQGEDGYELPNMLEERLLEAYDRKLIQDAIRFYEKKDSREQAKK